MPAPIASTNRCDMDGLPSSTHGMLLMTPTLRMAGSATATPDHQQVKIVGSMTGGPTAHVERVLA